MKVFKMNPIKLNGEIDFNYLAGCQKMLNDLLIFLQEETKFNPQGRMVDSVKLLDAILEATEEVTLYLLKTKKDIENG